MIGAKVTGGRLERLDLQHDSARDTEAQALASKFMAPIIKQADPCHS